MAQQTAVDFLVNELRLNLTIYKHTKNVIEQAKSMEKEQIEKAYIEGAEIAKEVLKEELKEVFVFPKSIFNENN